ncbi:hypothetical protein CVT25_008155 [Psilocybe cyanescens]|uniref:Uncharacterized protein n=1 Tax=Psilocybe cyanescens TaxID=93625 RepID=A0A409XSW7_PSICY|nr:hypothetical protein CVT25_008155 [Psilocybe cyanescens]
MKDVALAQDKDKYMVLVPLLVRKTGHPAGVTIAQRPFVVGGDEGWMGRERHCTMEVTVDGGKKELCRVTWGQANMMEMEREGGDGGLACTRLGCRVGGRELTNGL